MPLRAKILTMLVAAAADGQPCPTNKAIGQAVGRCAQAIGYHLGQLEGAGEIRRESRRCGRRRVYIVAAGQATAWTRRVDMPC